MADPALRDIFDTVRLPAYQPDQWNSARFRSGSNDVNRKYWNCFPSSPAVPNQAGAPEPWVEKRGPFGALGTDVSAILGAVNSCAYYNLAITQLDDVMVSAIWDATNSKFVIIQYRPNAATSVKIGELTGAASTDQIFLSELNIAGTPTLGVVYHNQDSTNSKGYYATSVAGLFPAASLTQIVDVDFPSNLGTPDHITGPMLQMNSTTYVMGKTGSIYNSDLNSITSWNSLGKIQAIQYPDQGIGLCRYKNLIVAFGEDSIEFFTDVGAAAPASPLQRTDQAFIKFGCVSPKSFMNIDDELFWIARSSTGTGGLWRLEGYTPVKLSKQDEDVAMSTSVGNLNIGPHVLRIWPLIFNAKKHIIIGLDVGFGNGLGIVQGVTSFSGDPNSMSTTEFRGGNLCMTLEEKEFWYFQGGFDTAGKKFFPLMQANFASNNANSNILFWPGAWVNGNGADTIGKNVFAVAGNITVSTQSGTDFASSTDFTGSIYSWGIQWAGVDFGTLKRKRIHKLHLVQRGFYASGSAGAFWFIWNKNDNTGQNVNEYNKDTNSRMVLCSNFSNRWYITNLGFSRNWTFAVVCKSIDPVAIRGLEIEMSLGMS